MSEKKYKSREEWKDVINALSAEDFQNLCYDIIKKNGFINPHPRGGGADGGRDIEAEFVYVTPTEEVQDKCWFQCKKQKNGVSFSQITTEIQQAEDQGKNKFFIVSNSDTTPDCKDNIKNWNEKNRCRVIDWTGNRFLDSLFGLPNVCQLYFPDESVPPIIDVKTPENMITKSSELGNQFGIELEFKIDKKVNLNNPTEVAEIIKETLLKIQGIDINIMSLLYQRISMYFFSVERSEDAIMFLNKSLDITPRNVEALLNKGYILEKIDQIEESNKCYDQILEIDSKNKFALNNKAYNLQRVGKFDKALDLIDKAIEIDTNFIMALYNKVNILKGLKKSKEALDLLNENVASLDKSINLQIAKVDLCLELLDLKEAYRINEEILKNNPDNIGAINNKGVIFEKNARFQQKEKYLKLALDCFEDVITKNDKHPLGWSNKVVVFINTGKIDEAEKIINIAYTNFPKNPYILNKKGVVLLNKRNPREALKYFDKASQLFFQEEFLLNKGQAHLSLTHWEQAKKTAEQLLKYNPEKSEAWRIKGAALKKLHQSTLANICFKNSEKFIEKPISLLEDDEK